VWSAVVTVAVACMTAHCTTEEPPPEQAQQVNDDLCHRLQAGNYSDLQGVSVTKQHLYLIERDLVYRVPLTSTYLNWNKRKIALYDRGDKLELPENRFEKLAAWNEIPRIKE